MRHFSENLIINQLADAGKPQSVQQIARRIGLPLAHWRKLEQMLETMVRDGKIHNKTKGFCINE